MAKNRIKGNIVIQDIKHYYSVSGMGFILDQGFYCLLLFRVGSLMYRSKFRKLNPLWYVYLIVYRIQLILIKIEMPASVVIGHRFFLPHPYGLVIGSKTVIGDDVRIGPWAVLGHNFDKGNPIIGNRCYIGPHACILGGISIGDDCIIGANAVITKPVSNNIIVYSQVKQKIVS